MKGVPLRIEIGPKEEVELDEFAPVYVSDHKLNNLSDDKTYKCFDTLG